MKVGDYYLNVIWKKWTSIFAHKGAVQFCQLGFWETVIPFMYLEGIPIYLQILEWGIQKLDEFWK